MKDKIVVRRDLELQVRLISLYHSLAVGGHSGITTTAKSVREFVILERATEAHSLVC
jgi:hypothetical protein